MRRVFPLFFLSLAHSQDIGSAFKALFNKTDSFTLANVGTQPETYALAEAPRLPFTCKSKIVAGQ